MQFADGREDRLAAREPGGVEDLDGALFGELRDALPERFIRARIDISYGCEVFGRERRNAIVGHGRTGGERISDRKRARVREPDDVARERFVDDLALAREELHRARHPDVLTGSCVTNRHVAFEFSATHAQERDAIAMARIHIRLDLEHESGELIRCRLDQRRRRIPFAQRDPSTRRRRHFQKAVQKEFHTEIRNRAPKKDRRRIARHKRGASERGARTFE